MIGWIYSVAGFWTGVTRDHQKKLEGTKTIVGASNRFGVVTDVGYDDFMQLGRPLCVVGVLSRLAAPRCASRSSQQRLPETSRPSQP